MKYRLGGKRPSHTKPLITSRWRPRWRKLRASWRDTMLLLREFAWPLLLFVLAMIGGGLVYQRLAERAGQPVGSRPEAVYLVLSLTFLQPTGDFPDVWYLQIFYFLMPVIGIGILAQGLADFGVLFFNRRARGKEWQMAVASTFSDHIVLIGLGHLGYRVLTQLHELGRDVVVIESNPKAELLDQAKAFNVPVLQDDGTREAALLAAGIARARAIIVCTQNDSMNLQIAFKARRLNNALSVVLRIFDYDFARALEEQFGFRAMSATGMSAPMFAAAAAGVDITRPVTIEGEALSLASMIVPTRSRLLGHSVAELEQKYDLSIVLLRHNHTSDFHPAGDRYLTPDDVVAVLGGANQIRQLSNDNQG